MSSQLENNNTTIQSVLDQVNALPTVSVTSVNDKTGKVVLVASDIGAAASDHEHTGYAVSDHEHTGYAASSHSQPASTITGGTFGGAVIAQTSSQTPSTSLLRNSKLVTADTTPSYNGEIYWTYA